MADISVLPCTALAATLVTLFAGQMRRVCEPGSLKILEVLKASKKKFQTALIERINKFWQSITLTHHLKGPVTVLGVHVGWRLHISAFDEHYLVEWYSILDLLLLHGIMSLKVDSKECENKLRIQGLISSSFTIEIHLAGLFVHPKLNHLGFLRGLQLFAVYQPQLQDHVFFWGKEDSYDFLINSHLLWLQLWLEMTQLLKQAFSKTIFYPNPSLLGGTSQLVSG